MVVLISGSVEEIPFRGVAIQMKPFWLTTFTYCFWGFCQIFTLVLLGVELLKRTFVFVCS